MAEKTQEHPSLGLWEGLLGPRAKSPTERSATSATVGKLGTWGWGEDAGRLDL